MTLVAGLLAVGLAAVHLVAGKLRFLDVIPRSRWLSGAGGVSVAYVFIHILPDLSRHQDVMQETFGSVLGLVENHAYLVALVGLATFYGLEHAARASRAERRQGSAGDEMSSGVFWIRMLSYGVYNALIGYLLLHREEPGLRSLLFFFTAMALHFVVNDYGLRQDHKGAYDRVGRWVLAAAPLLGWAIGATTTIHAAAVGVLFAFLAGGVILNVLKEELPEERASRFGAFALGAAGYAALLLALG
ncbi:MAG: hypothetical protein M3O34_19455 [Chloroflexota bacterium]|nr:hypothetical protein [Chloroflexota bacterium]